MTDIAILEGGEEPTGTIKFALKFDDKIIVDTQVVGVNVSHMAICLKR